MIFIFVSDAYDPFAETKEKLVASTGVYQNEIVTKNATDENGKVISTIMSLHGVTLCTIGYSSDGTPTTMIVYKDDMIHSTASYNTTTHTSSVIHFKESGVAETKYVETYNPIKNRAVRQSFNEDDAVQERNVLFFDENGIITKSMPAPSGPNVLPATAYNIYDQILKVLEMSVKPVEAVGFVMRVPLPVEDNAVVHSVVTVLIGVPIYVTTFTNQGNIPVALTLLKHGKVYGQLTYNPITFDGQLVTLDDDQQVKLIYNTMYDADLRVSEMVISNPQGNILSSLTKSFDENGNVIG